MPVTDTLFFTGPGQSHIIRVPDRSSLRAQTPQGFRISVLGKAYEYAMKDPVFSATDDCGVVKRYLNNEKILLVPGDEKNMKITYPGDLGDPCRLAGVSYSTVNAIPFLLIQLRRSGVRSTRCERENTLTAIC